MVSNLRMMGNVLHRELHAQLGFGTALAAELLTHTGLTWTGNEGGCGSPRQEGQDRVDLEHL